ncbi:caspase family protein [Paenibacillus sp. E222]|uniref:caspase family protein n=1 Tax=Paenibacillus sp. E222 TaxID=2748863 RepID=UPI0015C64EA1|nr:caspase family protein [Paenibacillus sp. E222]QLG37693.1 caspase family protein [Paenibacillus sp. E222]
MTCIKAFLVGVGDYTPLEVESLPFCQIDMKNFSTSLQQGIHVEKRNIVHLGTSTDGLVTGEEFWDKFLLFNEELNIEDTAIFYFSGHGTSTNPHYLVVSDDYIETQRIIEYLNKSKAKNKILFLDCCYSGNFNIELSEQVDINDALDKFNGMGCAVLTSSNAYQVSYGDSIGSVFTNILCNALIDKHLYKKGLLSLQDLQLWVKRSLEIHSLKNPNYPQDSIFRSNIVGTVYFKVEDYVPYKVDEYYLEDEDFTICSVNPVHNNLAKRYDVKVILKSVLEVTEIADIILKISEILKYANIYKNEIQKLRYAGQATNIIWVYFGFCEEDIVKSNFFGIGTWVDENQDKEWWYKIKNESDIILKNIHFSSNSFYSVLKGIMNEDSISDEEACSQLKSIRFEMINLAQSMVHSFNEFRNKIINDDEFFDIVTNLSPRINELFMLLTDMKFTSTKIQNYREAHLSLLGTIHDLSLFYNHKNKEVWKPRNRESLMVSTITRYHNDLLCLEDIEKGLIC